jgi:endonuclease/exonuclease/phosphatase family metal-dependent hydrolase
VTGLDRVGAWASVMMLALAAVAATGCGPVRTPENPTGPHLTVMTWNVNWGGPAPEEVCQAIAEADPDVVCLQETTPAWEALLRLRLAPRYPHMEFCHAERLPAAGFGVLSKGAIVSRDGEPGSGGIFGAGFFLVETPLGRVQLGNVHLHPPFDLETGRLSLGPTARIRRQEVQRLWERRDGRWPTLVLGDMNEGDGGEAVGWLKGQGLTDALREFDPWSHTWRWQWGILPLRDRLDHVFYGPPLHCLRAAVLDRGQSDPLPIVCVFELRPAGGSDGPGKPLDVKTP